MNKFTLSEISSFDNTFQLIKIIAILVFVLIACYYVTKWLGASGMVGGNTQNFKVIETYRIAQNKYLQIVKVGQRYLVLGVTKEHIEFLAELQEDEIFDSTLNKSDQKMVSFKNVLEKMNEKVINKRINNEQETKDLSKHQESKDVKKVHGVDHKEKEK